MKNHKGRFTLARNESWEINGDSSAVFGEPSHHRPTTVDLRQRGLQKFVLQLDDLPVWWQNSSIADPDLFIYFFFKDPDPA